MEPFEPHRLRDLDRRGRLIALGLAFLVVLIPLVAAIANVDRWVPQGDDALIVLRAHDVGTSMTPLVGQPSTSGTYGQQAANVAHPGPLGFVVLAPTARLFGEVWGTLLATAAVTAAALLTVCWLLYRHLGPRGGAAGAVLVALAAISAGGAGLVDPLSSNFGRFALLAAAVGIWAMLCGDLRVAPLTAAWWSFAAHQHLSVLPAAAVLAVAALAGAGYWVWRSPAEERLRSLAWLGGAVAVGLVLWSPVLWQEVSTDPGNLTALASYSGDPLRVDLGLRSAVDQVANVFGPRPFLGRSSVDGWDLVTPRSLLWVVLVIGVVVGILAAGVRWRRREHGFVPAVAMVGVLVVAGLVTGANVPDSVEQGRLNFFHWAFALSFFHLLLLGWLIARLAPVVTPTLTHGRRSTALVVAAVVVAVVALVPVVVDRPSDRLIQGIDAEGITAFTDELHRSAELDAVDGPVLVLVNGDDRFVQVGDTVGVRLLLDGRDIVFPPSSVGFVHPDRLADMCEVEHALVIGLELFELAPPPGTLLASADAAPSLDRAALERVVAQAEGQPIDLGPDLEAALAALPGDQGDLIGSAIGYRLATAPERLLQVPGALDLLVEHPPASPVLDVDDLEAMRDAIPEGTDGLAATTVTAHLLDRDELEVFRGDLVAGC